MGSKLEKLVRYHEELPFVKLLEHGSSNVKSMSFCEVT